MNLENIDLLKIGHSIQLVGMVLTDYENDISYVTKTPFESIFEIENLTLSQEDWKTLLRQTDIQEVEVLAEDRGGVKKAILRKTTRQIDSVVSWNVYRRDNYTCRYCGRNDVPLTVDHLVLWEDGGPSIEENLVSACKRCNKTRGNMKYEEWLSSEKYEKLSKDLPSGVKTENIEVLYTLRDIPIRLHIPSRGKKKKKKR